MPAEERTTRSILLALAEHAAREIAAYRQRQISTFREFVIVQALITWGVGQLNFGESALQLARQLAAGASLLAGILGCWIILIYKRRIYLIRNRRDRLVATLIKEFPELTEHESPFYPTTNPGPWWDLLRYPSSTAYAGALIAVSLLAALANWIAASR